MATANEDNKRHSLTTIEIMNYDRFTIHKHVEDDSGSYRKHYTAGLRFWSAGVVSFPAPQKN
jgi:hypothetical protein